MATSILPLALMKACKTPRCLRQVEFFRVALRSAKKSSFAFSRFVPHLATGRTAAIPTAAAACRAFAILAVIRCASLASSRVSVSMIPLSRSILIFSRMLCLASARSKCGKSARVGFDKNLGLTIIDSTKRDKDNARWRARAESLVCRLRRNSALPANSRNANGTIRRK